MRLPVRWRQLQLLLQEDEEAECMTMHSHYGRTGDGNRQDWHDG